MMQIPQSTARVVMLKLFTTGTTTAATGKTLAITISKAGAAFGNPAAGASNATEISAGWYKFSLGTGDVDTLGDLVVRGTAAACDDSERIFGVVSATTGGATNLDAAVSSRMASYTQPTGFLAATFPSGTLANTTNITAGTITTVTTVTTTTTLTNLPAITADWLTGTGVAASAATKIANEVEAQIIDETDSEKVLAAITDKIASVNPSLSGLTLAAIASAVRTNLTTELARLDTSVGSRATQTSVDDLPTNAELATALGTADDAMLAAIADLNNLTADTVAALITADHGVGSYLRNTEPDNAGVAAIKAKTDSLTFTVANVLNANIAYVNGIQIAGSGTTGVPWRPAP